jgi:nicotinate-nucleotide adenylyltransferase
VARIGILGGMFNPPHVGHLALARSAVEDLGLERVLLTPTLIPHKPVEHDPGAEHRLRMCELAVGEDPRLGVCTLELERPGPSYTVDTLRSIHASDPDAEVTLIVGADMARTLDRWREPHEIVKLLARVAVAGRDDSTRAQVSESLEPLGVHTAFLGMKPIDVSSSAIRERILAGEPVERSVGREVAGYIAEHALYRSGPGMPGPDVAGPGMAGADTGGGHDL